MEFIISKLIKILFIGNPSLEDIDKLIFKLNTFISTDDYITTQEFLELTLRISAYVLKNVIIKYNYSEGVKNLSDVLIENIKSEDEDLTNETIDVLKQYILFENISR